MKEVVPFLRSRLFRNLLFWAIFGGLKFTDADNVTHVLFIFIGLALFALLAYFNNLYMVPRFLANRKAGIYFLVTIPFVFFFTVLYVYLVKLLTIYYPDVPIIRVSSISSPVNQDVSFTGIVTDKGFQTYMWTAIEWVFSFTLLWYLNDYTKKAEQVKEAKKSR